MVQDHRRSLLAGIAAVAIATGVAAWARTESATEGSAGVLSPMRWNPSVRTALNALIAGKGSGSASYSEDSQPAAVFVLDDVLAAHSPGEAVFQRLVDRAEFKFSDAFWALVPDPYGRRARVGWESFKNSPKAAWAADPYYGMYRKAMFGAYENLCREWGPRKCRPWLAQLMIGFGDTELTSYIKQALDDAEVQPLGWEAVIESPGDERPVRIRTGVRVIPEMKALVKALQDHGFAVFVLSDSPEWVAAGMASRYGIDTARVIGPRTRLRNRVVTDEVLDPIPVGVGEAEAMTMEVGDAPALEVGGSKDRSLLDYGGADSLRVAIDSGDPQFRKYIRTQKWLVQSSFVPLAGR